MHKYFAESIEEIKEGACDVQLTAINAIKILAAYTEAIDECVPECTIEKIINVANGLMGEGNGVSED